MIIKKNISIIFNLFLLTHLVVWTLVPFFSNKNLPLDVIEALAWGSNLGWGWDKHPPLSVFFSGNYLPNFWSARLGILFTKPNICHIFFCSYL